MRHQLVLRLAPLRLDLLIDVFVEPGPPRERNLQSGLGIKVLEKCLGCAALVLARRLIINLVTLLVHIERLLEVLNTGFHAGHELVVRRGPEHGRLLPESLRVHNPILIAPSPIHQLCIISGVIPILTDAVAL